MGNVLGTLDDPLHVNSVGVGTHSIALTDRPEDIGSDPKRVHRSDREEADHALYMSVSTS